MTSGAFTPVYKELSDAVLSRCGAAALGCFCAMARKADYSGGWVLEISLRDLADYLGMTVVTLRNSVLEPLAAAGLIDLDSRERAKTRVVLTAMVDIESGKGLQSVLKINTDEKEKNKSVLKFNTDWSALFPDMVVHAGPASVRTGAELTAQNQNSVLKNDTDLNENPAKTAPKNETVLKINTDLPAPSVLNFNTDAQISPLLTPKGNINNNNDVNKQQKDASQKSENKKNAAPCTLEEVKQFFTEKKFLTDPEYFFYKNEAADWKWFDKKTGKWKPILKWKGTAYVFDKYEKRNGRVNFNNPATPEEKLFCWYCAAAQPEIFNNEEARQSEWGNVRGSCARIIAACGGFEHAQAVVLHGVGKLEGKFNVSLRAVANNVYTYRSEVEKRSGYPRG